MGINCKDITKEILLHEIIGETTTVAGVNLVVCEEGNQIVSGVNKINFESTILEASAAGGGEVTVKTPLTQVDDNILWVYDETRTKWLSSFRTTFSAGEKGRAKNKYLLTFDSQAINLTGYRLVRDATITAISVQTRNDETWTLRVRKNGDPTNIASLVMTGVSGNHSNSTNVDLDEGDRIQFYAETTTFLGIKDPLVWVEVAWRNGVLVAP